VSGTATEDGAESVLKELANALDVDVGKTLSVVGVPSELPAGVSYNAVTRKYKLDPLPQLSWPKWHRAFHSAESVA
jgi:hypothetical protein